MQKLTIRLKNVAFSAILITASVISVSAQDTVTEEVPVEEVTEEVVVQIPVQQALTSFDIPEDLIIDRLNCLENDVKLTYNSKIKGFIDYFTIRNRNYLQVMEVRKNVYFPIFEHYLKKHNMPDELKYLSIVESGLNPKAKSRVGAAGLWQFMPSTGKIYHLRQDSYIDERLDPYEATEAACLYLKQLYNIFHDWELALASYNCGPGNVRRAIRKSGYKESFWAVYNYLPQETRSYVPQFVAITYVMNHLSDYQIKSDTLEYPMAFDTIMINQSVNLDKLAENLNICKDDLLKLNPGLKRDVVPAYLKYALRVPADVINTFQENRIAILDSCKVSESLMVAYEEVAEPARITYKVKKGDYLGKIADKYNVNLSDLRSWNKLKSNNVWVGQSLTIYTKKSGSSVSSNRAVASTETSTNKNAESVSEAISEKKVEKTTVNTYHKVKSGENLSRIADKYNVSTAQIKAWNKMKGSVIHVGDKLIVKKSQVTVESESIASKPRETKIYYVQPGDTLWSISKKHNGISVEEIKKKNNLKDENIKVGMKLIVG